MTKVLFAALKDQKISHDDNEGKSTFQIIAIELYEQPKKQARKDPLRLAISSTGVGVVAKSDDEVYILNTMKVYSYFSFVFYAVPKKVELLKISKVM